MEAPGRMSESSELLSSLVSILYPVPTVMPDSYDEVLCVCVVVAAPHPPRVCSLRVGYSIVDSRHKPVHEGSYRVGWKVEGTGGTGWAVQDLHSHNFLVHVTLRLGDRVIFHRVSTLMSPQYIYHLALAAPLIKLHAGTPENVRPFSVFFPQYCLESPDVYSPALLFRCQWPALLGLEQLVVSLY